MTNEQILRAAIEKAVKNGYVEPKRFETGLRLFQWIDMKYTPGKYMSQESIIFSHEFAKAFWGELETGEVDCGCLAGHACGKCEIDSPEFDWQWHLQKMVLEEDPIKYLEQFLKEKK